jgi:hypothetical protein
MGNRYSAEPKDRKPDTNCEPQQRWGRRKKKEGKRSRGRQEVSEDRIALIAMFIS